MWVLTTGASYLTRWPLPVVVQSLPGAPGYSWQVAQPVVPIMLFVATEFHAGDAETWHVFWQVPSTADTPFLDQFMAGRRPALPGVTGSLVIIESPA